MNWRTFVPVTAALLCAAPAAAQQAWTVELGGFGRYTDYDSKRYGTTGLDGPGGGGRVGLFLTRLIELELDVPFTPSDLANSDGHVPVHARFLVNVPLTGRTRFLIGAGGVRNDYLGGSGPDNGIAALAGFRFGVHRWSFRLDATADRVSLDGGSATDFGAQLGLSLLLGSGKRDSDRDGVVDKLDRCFNTPVGEAVDAAGCPRDGDADGVPDKADKCPNTPAGEAVDAAGCFIDTDRDAVPDRADKCPGTPAGDPVDDRGCPRDSDGDGVPDIVDKCPGTPAGEPIDDRGCRRDTDGDGVPDREDRCPNTPAGEEVDTAGCMRDSDADTVPDKMDKCPGTPANEPVDATGCPFPKDSDGDGVMDPNDRCAGTPAGVRVDAAGCPILFREGEATLTLPEVQFESGKAVLTTGSMPALDALAKWLAAYPEVRIEIGGHTDSQGARARNVSLSQARAQAVKDYLITKGVSPDRLVAKGYGPDKPVVSNRTPDGRAKNRRVELKRLD